MTVSDGIAEIRLNRPERLNAINPDLLSGFAAALEKAEKDPGVEVILICGEGRAFCAGDDLKEFHQQSSGKAETRRFIEDIQRITELIVNGEKIVVGAIHGWAVGGGFEWVLNCDLAIMAEGCRCFLPEINLGLFVTGGISALLPNAVGLQKAKAMILFGEQITAKEALDMGLVYRVAPDDRVYEEAVATAARIAGLPKLAQRNVKKVLNRSFQLSLADAMKLETDATVDCFLDPETAVRIGNTEIS